VTGIDRVVGAIRALLEKEGIADNTIIIFSSDHGKMHGEFGLGGKALNYEACLRVPMIVYDPRLPDTLAGRRSMALVESVDVAPTLLDYAGIDRRASMQGLSLRPLIEGDRTTIRDASFAENLWSTVFGNPRIESVRTSEWKYIRYFENDRGRFADLPWETRYEVTPDQLKDYASWLTASIRGEQPVHEELFHLASDPGETTNLADRPAQAEILAEMRSRCQELVTMAKGDVDAPPATLVVPGIKDKATRKIPDRISLPTND
jgi:arylsulfatase A-like enzyme